MQAVAQQSCAEGLDRTVLALRAFYAQRETNLTWVTAPTLERDFGISERRVREADARLRKLGELRRRPDLERHDRKRVYEVTPGGEIQLTLIDGVHPAPDVPTNGAGCTDPGSNVHLRARVEGTDVGTEVNGTPQPPKGGRTETQGSAAENQTTPRVDPPERSTATRRRRARRRRSFRGGTGAPDAPTASCPLAGESTDREAIATLAAAWRAIEEPLRQRLGDDTCEIWLAGAHLHHAGDTLELGLGPSVTAWVAGRWGPLLEELAGKPIHCVPCAGAGYRQATGVAT